MYDAVIFQEHIKDHPPNERCSAYKYPKNLIPDCCAHAAEDKIVSLSPGDYIKAFSAAEDERTGPVRKLMGKSAGEVKNDLEDKF